MSMMYDPNNPQGGMNAQQGFLGGLKSAAMGMGQNLMQAGQSKLFGASPQITPGQPMGNAPDGSPMTGPPQASMQPNNPMQALQAGKGQGGLLGNLGQNLMNNKIVSPALKFGQQLASYF